MTPPPEPPRLSARWERLRSDGSLKGRDWSKAATAVADEWLKDLFRRACAAGAGAPEDREATGTKLGEGEAAPLGLYRARSGAFGRWRRRQQGDQPGLPSARYSAQGVALIAVGSLGRGDVVPGSDLDLLLVHAGQPDVTELADRLWYPIWDDPMPLDHSVRTIPQVAQAAESDLRVALGLLEARLLAGDQELAQRLSELTGRLWEKRVPRWLPQLLEARSAAQDALGEVAFVVEPNLQEARGGLRDVQLLSLLGKVTPVLPASATSERLREAADLLHSVRVEIQRTGGRRNDRLFLEDHERVAAALGMEGREVLAHAVADAGRTVAWVVEDASRRAQSWIAGPRGRGGSADKPLGPGLVLRDDEVTVPAGTAVATDPTLALRAAGAAAELGLPLSRQALARLAAEAPAPPSPWPEEVLRSLLRLLSSGQAAVHAIETLDQLGIWEKYLPEWPNARNRPQFDPYHRWTVDRHLLETVANAAAHLRDVRRPDLLLLGALLHDIGKGASGPTTPSTGIGHTAANGPAQELDHSHAGAEIAERAAQRFGLSSSDASILVRLVLHHLLLPDTATRRDVEDPATAEAVVAAAGDAVTLELLAALASADGVATGPSAWSQWKARLVERLVERAGALLEGRPLPEGPAFPNEEQRRLLARRTLQVVPGQAELVVVAPDRPGLLSDVTGALALHEIGILEARAHSEEGWALEVFGLDLLEGAAPRWQRISGDVEAAVRGHLNVSEALARHEQASGRRRRRTALPDPTIRVGVDNSTATEATVLEVRAPDTRGLLHRVTAVLAGLGLDISSARATTLGTAAVDTFYVRADGTKLSEAGAEVARSAVQQALEPVFGELADAKPARNTAET